MPQQRKPLMGVDVLPVPGPGVIDRVIGRQRESSSDVLASLDEPTSTKTAPPAVEAQTVEAAPTGKQASRSRRTETQVPKLIEQAKKGGETIVTYRVPKAFDDYAESYVSRVKRTDGGARYRKQDVYAEALAAWILAHPLPPDPIDQSIFGLSDDE